MDVCTFETGLLKKKPCGETAVTKCGNCEQPLCKKHAVPQVSAGQKKAGGFLCPECAKAWKQQEKTVGAVGPSAGGAAPAPAAKKPAEPHAKPPAAKPPAAKPPAAKPPAAKPPAATAPAAKPAPAAKKSEPPPAEDSGPLEFTTEPKKPDDKK